MQGTDINVPAEEEEIPELLSITADQVMEKLEHLPNCSHAGRQAGSSQAHVAGERRSQ